MDVQKINNAVKTKVTAHAGSMNTPDDSLESVVAGVQIKVDICEVDVNMLDDGTPVLKHNPVLPGDNNLERLSKVFEYVKDKNVKLNLDIKDFRVVDRVESEAANYGVEDEIFYTGIEEESAGKLQSSGSKIRYYLNHDLKDKSLVPDYDNYINELIDTTKKLGALGINTDYRYCTADAVDKIHKAGLLASVWTVDDASSMEKFLNMGVDNITTRYPDVLIEILNRKWK